MSGVEARRRTRFVDAADGALRAAQLWHRPSDGPRRTVVAARHHDRLSRVERGLEIDLGKQKTMSTPNRIEFDAHKRARLGHTFMLQLARQPVESPLGWGVAGGVS